MHRLASLLPGLGSAVPELTEAELTMHPGSSGLTVMVTVAASPAGNVPNWQRYSLLPRGVQPLPWLAAMDNIVTVVGSRSVTTTVLAAEGP